MPWVLWEDHLIRSKFLSMPSFSFEIFKMKGCHPCLPSIFHHCFPSCLNQNYKQNNHIFVLFFYSHPCLIGSSMIAERRISSSSAYVIKHFYTIGSHTMPNVMFEWLLSSKPALTVRALFVWLSWHGLNIIKNYLINYSSM